MKSRSIRYILGLVLVLAAVFGVVLFYFNRSDSKQEEISEVIPIAMALDDGYLYPTIVAITSMMENKSSNTIYRYYIMHP